MAAQQSRSTRVERRDILDKMIASKALSADGANWLRKSLDPFHDFEVSLRGYPDANTSKVVIQEVTLSKQISAPGTTGYDMHIFTLPELHTLPIGSNLNQALTIDQYGTVTTANTSFNLLPNSNFPIAPITIVTGPVGSYTTWDGTNNSAGVCTVQNFDFSPWLDGQKRVIGMAFEVHDTTAELYKQGTVTVYRLPQVINVQQLNFISGTNTGKTPSVTYVSRSPPSNLASTLLLPGTRQWEAKDGCYCVATFDDRKMELQGNEYGSRVFTSGDFASSGASTAGFGSIPLATADPSAWSCQLRSFKPIPFHTSGAYFTGLNANSTFTVTVKLLLEVAPTPDNQQLVVLSQPSPDFDPVAIELYKHASQMLAPGVPVGENASGDFWDGVLGVIEKVAPVIGGIIPLPGASMLGSVIGSAAKAGRDVRNSASDRKQKNDNFSPSKPGGQGAKNSMPAKKPASAMKKK